ncbi:hypothetical protein DSCO28_15360 [Desulfosarcina ovata subsp. sediminis]|uniref:DUF4125 domain-containing protein n=1 Tax=Desulfosarcina ovata subsp. sediminis TaxID=885957 RepID=A0A5K7ZPN1_9BACT|nr:DUF4125 family protein [Desulfosarcina ovata]BBO80970.1 hypothetical protein DSCO28_15360 [Desulfosarcina ovata subsp. sediminis]
MATLKNRATIVRILDLEWEMFQQVKGETPAACQRLPDNFRKIRGSLFETWGDFTLEAYRHDLERARRRGANLLVQKYARMDERIPPLKTADGLEMIRQIVVIERGWQVEIADRYPAVYRHLGRSTAETGDGSDFSVYLACELETYGDETLASYYRDTLDAARNQQNLALESLDILLRKGGWESIDQAECNFAQNDA